MLKEVLVDFGDIYYSEIEEHFFLMLGATESGFLYIKLTSRVYRPFEMVRDLFNNHCIYCDTFKNNFPKDSDIVVPAQLKDCFFIDKIKYWGYLKYDSLAIFQNDPQILTKKDYKNFKSNGKFKFIICLDKVDVELLHILIRTSDNISQEKKDQIKESYKIVKRRLNKQEQAQRDKEFIKKIKKAKKNAK